MILSNCPCGGVAVGCGYCSECEQKIQEEFQIEAKCDWADCEDLVLHTVRGVRMCEGCYQQAAAYVRRELHMVPDVVDLTDEQINDAYISGEQDAPQPAMDSPLHAVWELGWLDTK